MENSKLDIKLIKKNKYQLIIDEEIVIKELHKVVCIPNGVHTIKCVKRHSLNMPKVVFYTIFFQIYLIVTSDLEEFLNYIFSKVKNKITEYEVKVESNSNLILHNGFVEICDEKGDSFSVLPIKQYTVDDIEIAKKIIFFVFIPICVLLCAFFLMPLVVGCWLFFSSYYLQGISFFALSIVMIILLANLIKKSKTLKVINSKFKIDQ